MNDSNNFLYLNTSSNNTRNMFHDQNLFVHGSLMSLESSNLRPRLVNVLYVERNLDERRSAQVLQESTSSMTPITCSFNVVQTAFTGLEFMESANYDIVFIHKDMEHLNAEQFLKALKNIRLSTEVVIIVEAGDNTIDEAGSIAYGFSGLLRKGYLPWQLCRMIRTLISKTEQSLGIEM